MKKILTFILSNDIEINSGIISQIRKIADKFSCYDPNQIFLIVDYRGDDEPLVVKELLSIKFGLSEESVQELDHEAFGLEFSGQIIKNMKQVVDFEKVFSERLFVIIVCKSHKRFGPNRIMSHVAEIEFGSDLNFTPIYALD